MKKAILAKAVLLLLICSSFKPYDVTNWKIKENNYTISFKGGNLSGSFKGLKTTILFNENDLAKSKISASIDVTSLDMGNGLKEKHAKSDNALDAKDFPTASFESSSIIKTATGYDAIGKLNLKKNTQEIHIPFSFENKGNEATFKGTFSIKTKDFDITRWGSPSTVDVSLVVNVVK